MPPSSNDEKEPLDPLSVRACGAYGHFAETTTFGGVIHTYLSPHWLWKSIWVVIVLLLLGATCWNTAMVVNDFLDYPVTTKVSVSYQPSVPFPTVTVCNRNPVKCLQLTYAYIKYEEELRDLMNYSNCAYTVPWQPLVYRLFTKNDTTDPAVLNWRAQKTNEILDFAQRGVLDAFPLMAISRTDCLDLLQNAGEQQLSSIKDTLKILVEGCQADMTDYLFPRLSTQPVSSTNPGLTNPDTAVQVATQPTKTSDTTATTEDSLGTGPLVDLSWDDAPVELQEMEKFVSELSTIAKNQSRLYLLRALLDKFDGFVINCTYFGTNCRNETEFTTEFSPEYGTCFSFNSAFGNKANNVSGIRKAYLTGATFGLSMELVLDQDNYLPSSAAAGAGARVAISAPGLRPNPADEGYYIKPHSEADMSLRLLKVSRLEDPYTSHCWKDWSTTPFKPLIYNPVENTTRELTVYSYSECRQVCSSYLLAKTCRCVDARNPQPFMKDGIEYTHVLKVCDLTNATDAECRQKVLNQMQSDSNYQCDCNLPCEDNAYSATSSTSEWPSDMYMPLVIKKYRQRLIDLNDELAVTAVWDAKATKIVSRELTRVNVYLQTLNIEEITEEAKYDFFQLLSDLGGALGLYLGFCGITLFEIAEFLILISLSLVGFNPAKMGDKAGDPGDGDLGRVNSLNPRPVSGRFTSSAVLRMRNAFVANNDSKVLNFGETDKAPSAWRE